MIEETAEVEAAATSDRPWRRVGRDVWVSLGIAVGVGAVYVRSLLPGIGYSGDTAKWQLLGEVGGVPHATGYPLYAALDQAWVSLVPWGSVAWRVNLLSAVLGVAAVVVLYGLLRILGLAYVAAAAAALTFAFTVQFWTQAIVAEVYTLHTLFLVGVTACLARWRLGGLNRWLVAGLALLALSFGHHLTTVLAVPGVAWLVWSDRQRALRWRNLAWVALAGVVAAAQYLYVLRMTDVGGYVEFPVHSLGALPDIITGGSFKDDMFAFGLGELLRDRVGFVADLVVDEYLVVLLVPAAGGLWLALRRWDGARRDVAVHLVLLGLCTAVYVMNFDVLDVVVFALPLFWVVAVFLGVGLDRAAAWARDRWPGRAAAGWVAVALLVVPAVTGLVDYRRASQRGAVRDAERIERALAAAGEHAVLVTDNYQDSEYVWYYLLGEHMAETHGLELASQVTPAEVREYLTAGAGPVAVVVADVEGVTDPPLYTPNADTAADLRAAGIELTEVAPDVWRIDGA